MTPVAFRPATAADLPFVQETLYLALAWDPDDPIPPIEPVINHPEIVKYHADWGRAGDAGVVAESDGDFVGMAYYRYFPEDDPGQGFVDPDTPELAIAVREGHRGRGIGSRLLDAIHRVARQAGASRMSLSVSDGNRAARLYERAGYALVPGRDEVMLLELTRIL